MTQCGVVNLLKPPGMTSNDAVVDVRRLLGVKKAGHTGTLDPAAAGVLPVCVGRATRLCPLLTGGDKTYVAEIAFGAATDTDDAQGTVIARGEADVRRPALEQILASFTGVIDQTPPAYSALHVDGQRMYALARKGLDVRADARQVTVHSLDVLEQTGLGRFLLRIHCGKGTYVRALFRDMGRELGTVAHMAFLLRTAAGPFDVERSVTLQELFALRQEALLSAEEAVAHLPQVEVEGWRKDAMRNGLSTWRKHVLTASAPMHTPLRVYCASSFMGVGHLDEQSLFLDINLAE